LGGTASIFNNALRGKDISLGYVGSSEHHAILFKCQPPVLAMTLYRPRKQRHTIFTDISELFSIVLENYDKLIVLGDFSSHVGKVTDSTAIEFMTLLSSMDFIQHTTGPIHRRGHTLVLVITKRLSIDISSIVDVALSDHHCGRFTSLLPKVQGNTEHIIKKHSPTSEVATDFIGCMNNTPSPILPSSCDDFLDHVKSQLGATIDATAPVGLKIGHITNGEAFGLVKKQIN
jgi:hypothetical protein